MNEQVKKVFQDHVWVLATMGESLNVVPIGTTCITEDEKLLLGDVMMVDSVANIKATGKAAVCAWDPRSAEGYQIKGSAVYETAGPNFEQFNKAVTSQSRGSMQLKGVIVLNPEETVVLTPGPGNKKRI